MSILTDEATAAYGAEQAKAEAAAETQRKALRTGATDALRALLVRADGTRLTLTAASLTVRDADIDAEAGNGRVVWSDGTLSLAAILDDGAWQVFLVAEVDGQWQRTSEALDDLADLGAALPADPSAAAPESAPPAADEAAPEPSAAEPAPSTEPVT